MSQTQLSGRADVAVAFSIGWAVRLDALDRTLESATRGEAYGRSPRAPLELTRRVDAFVVGGFVVEEAVVLTLYDFGAVSVRFGVGIRDVDLEALVRLSAVLSGNRELHARARAVVTGLLEEIQACVQEPSLGEMVEDYCVFRLATGSRGSAHEVLAEHAPEFARIARAETEPLSARAVESALDRAFSCFSYEAAMIGWCSTVLLTSQDGAGTPAARLLLAPLELANTQLLEFRYLFRQLDELTEASERALLRRRITSDDQLRLDKLMLTLSELFGLITSGLEVFDNERLADAHEVAGTVFRFPQKSEALQAELSHLADVTQRIDQKHDVRHSHRLEIVVILLILVEVVRAFFE
jgi:energy-coupling factor transporter transmembrane protein EcfT